MYTRKRQPGADNCHSTYMRTCSLRPPHLKKTLNKNDIFANKMQDNAKNLD